MADITAQDPAISDVMPEIPLYRERLANGLTLQVYEDPQAENVSIHIAYGVGAKDEPAGMFGFAHLLEHLMFSGSQGLPGSFIQHLQQAGAQGLNGVTTADMTRFFQTVPPGSVDFALFAESDRMGYLTQALTPEALDVQRRVVIREMDENESQPYGKVQGALLRNLYPAHHPYAHKVAGEVTDLENTGFEEAVRWIQRYYRPNNAVLTLAGKITATQALEKVTHWFGALPPGEPLEYSLSELPALSHLRKVVVQDNVDETLLRICWPLPSYNSPVSAAMEIFAGVLANLEGSLLIQQLMVNNAYAIDVSAFIEQGILCSVFNLRIMLQPGIAVTQVEDVINHCLQQVLDQAPDADLYADGRQLLLSSTYGDLSDPLGLADAVGKHALLARDNSGLHQRINQALAVTDDEIHTMARQWLGEGRLWLTVEPFNVRAENVDPSPVRTPPAVILPSPRTLPQSDNFTLSNGLQVKLFPSSAEEQVTLSLLLPAGAVYEAPGEEGLAQLVCSLLAAGTLQYDAQALHQWLQHHQVYFEAEALPDVAVIHMFMPRTSLPEVLPLLTSMVSEMQPTEDTTAAHRDYFRQMMAGCSVKDWALPRIIYDEHHPLRQPAFSQGSDRSLQRLTTAQVNAFYRRCYRPAGATLLLFSSNQRSDIEALLTQTLGTWSPQPSPERPPLPAPADKGSVVLVDKPNNAINTLSVFFPLPGRGDGYDAELQIIHQLLAASFGSRINYNLREVHQLTYNVVAHHEDLPGCQLTGFEVDVAAKDTLAAVKVIMDELHALQETRMITQDELSGFARTGFFSVNQPLNGDHDVMMTQELLCRAGLPADYFTTLSEQMLNASLGSVCKQVKHYLHPSRARWLMTGDLNLLTEQLGSLTELPVCRLPEDLDELYS